MVYLDIGDGWLPLVEALVTDCEANGGTVVQVKEKFGGLRFYYDKPYDSPETFWKEFEKRVLDAEDASYNICERCGAPGKLRNKGWMKTLCDEHAGGSASYL